MKSTKLTEFKANGTTFKLGDIVKVYYKDVFGERVIIFRLDKIEPETDGKFGVRIDGHKYYNPKEQNGIMFYFYKIEKLTRDELMVELL